METRGKRILILNYGMGNLQSIANAIDYLQGKYFISNEPKAIKDADAIIMPGVGAFGRAMKNLQTLNLIEHLNKAARIQKKPILGICLGLQLMADHSTELGFYSGLGWISGAVEQLDKNKVDRIPHVGWNNIEFKKHNPLFANIPESPEFYFDHAYHLICNPDQIAGTTMYGDSIAAVIQKENIVACQFHPEKSHSNGLRFLRNVLNFMEQY